MKKFVYFIADTDRRVKIGVSHDPRARLASLQTASAEALTLLGSVVGAYKDENAWHTQYVGKRITGEWFTLDEELSLAIANACRQVDVPAHNAALIKRLRQIEVEKFLIDREIADVYAELRGVDATVIETALRAEMQFCLEAEQTFKSYMSMTVGGCA